MYPGALAKTIPDKPAYIMATSGEAVTYAQLDERSNRCARMLRACGLEPGASIAILLENHPRFFDACWAAQRSGLYYTPIAKHLRADEIEYIANDCGADVLITSYALRDTAAQLSDRMPAVRHRFMLDGTIPGFDSFEEALAAQPPEPLEHELEGQDMLYSSGTTGRPKGIKNPLPDRAIGTPPPMLQALAAGRFGCSPDTVYLSPAPLYHSAPLRFTMTLQRLGATSIVMERFDPLQALELIERYRVTLSQWVPTMFVRMLKLSEEERHRFDLSSQKVALHSAAPCPIEVKERMIEWWGPILVEYYGATEGHGGTQIESDEWLTHKGSIGRPNPGHHVHVLDDAGNELPPGEIGTIYFSGGETFEYHGDAGKTTETRSKQGYATVGDVGYVDEDGYVYLTDRKAHMIITGGVNVYPQETENVLIVHPKVFDAAVIGVPNDEFGEEVKAVVQPADPTEAGPELERELIAWCRERLSAVKCPRSVDFERELPRSETGKLYKRLLRDRYWQGRELVAR
jgi:acyl-CoA synthetase (AMP-forming)/AMP-acid ligase II